VRRKKGIFYAGAAVTAAGLLFAAFPWLKAGYYEYKKDKTLNEWDAYALLTSPDGAEIAKGMEIPQAPVYSAMSFTAKQLDKDGVLAEEVNPKIDTNYMLANMTGTITIKSVNLRSPILKGDTESNLDLGICELDETIPMGGQGNYLLAGHKSRVYGRHFSRLHEVSPGDVVQVSDGINSYKYEVFEKLHVSADDTWILGDTSDSIMTMITCDYTQQPVGRLVVRARIVNEA
jgi:sortase A